MHDFRRRDIDLRHAEKVVDAPQGLGMGAAQIICSQD